MKAYQIKPHREGNADQYIRLVYENQYGAVSCQLCGGVWGISGNVYPSLDPVLLAVHTDIMAGVNKVVSVEQYRNDKADFDNNFSLPFSLSPGMQFGKITATSWGANVADFLFHGWWNVFAKRNAINLLMDNGIRLNTNAVFFKGIREADSLDSPDSPPPDLVQIECYPGVNLSEEFFQVTCGDCGRLSIRISHGFTLARNSYNSDIPLQRIKEVPSLIIANEYFVRVANQKGFSGLRFEEVNLV